MVLHVRYWDSSLEMVKTQYYNSEFSGKAAAAVDIIINFQKGKNGIEEDKMLQVSMDGPNVNMSFLSNLNAKRSECELSKLISIGSCSLHTMYCSFKHGTSALGWKLNKLLSSLYKIFH